MDLMQSIAVASAITILILDFKGDFVDVPNRLGRDRWRHFSATDGLRLGCAPPLACNRHVSWVNQLTKIFAAECDLAYSETTLATVVRTAVNLLNAPPGPRLIWPSLLLIEQLLDALPTGLIARKDQYKQSAQQQIEHVRRNDNGLFTAAHGFDIVEHLVKPRVCAVIDCTLLSPLLARLLVNSLALQLLFVRISLRQVSQRTNFVLIIDEADPICSNEAAVAYPEGYSPLGQLVKQGRQFGVAVCLGMMEFARCSPFISSNAGYHLIFNQTDPRSAEESARTLMEPSARQLVASQDCGQFIFREAMGPVRYGMLAKADHVPASDLPRPDTFDRHDFTPPLGIADIPGFAERIEALRNEYKKTALRQSQTRNRKSSISITANERAFLDYLSLHECEPVHRVFARMGNPAPATQKRILDGLAQKELIWSEQIQTARAFRIAGPTETGWKYLNKQSRFSPLRGGHVHTFVCRSVQALAIKRGCDGCRCECAYPDSSGIADVCTRIRCKLYYTEVVVDCDSNIDRHVRSCFLDSDKVESLTIVTLLKSEHEPLHSTILADAELVFCIGRILFVTVDQILKELYSDEGR